MKKPIDIWVLIWGYIIAVLAGLSLSVFFIVLTEVIVHAPAEGFDMAHFVKIVAGFASGTVIGAVFALPFASVLAMALALPFTLVFLLFMRYFRIRSLSVLLFGGAIAPSTAIFLGLCLLGLLSNSAYESGNLTYWLGITSRTVPAGMAAAYILYRISLRPCFDKGVSC